MRRTAFTRIRWPDTLHAFSNTYETNTEFLGLLIEHFWKRENLSPEEHPLTRVIFSCQILAVAETVRLDGKR